MEDRGYLENEHIRLRALEPEDVELLFRWENDSALWHTGNTLTPYSHYDLKTYIAQAREKNIYELKQLRLIIEERKAGKAIGALDLYDFDPHHRRAGVGILLAPAAQRQGWATQALELLAAYAFAFLKLHQLYAHVPVDNEASKRLFLRSGFRVTGTLTDWLTAPQGYTDVLVLQRIGHN